MYSRMTCRGPPDGSFFDALKTESLTEWWKGETMRKKMKKAAALMLSAALCFSMAAQAAPGGVKNPAFQPETAQTSVKTDAGTGKDTAGENGKDTKKDAAAKQTEDGGTAQSGKTADGEKTGNEKDQADPSSKKPETEKELAESAPEKKTGTEAGEETEPDGNAYRILLPVKEGVSYKTDPEHVSGILTTAEYETLLYEAGEAVTFLVEGSGDFSIRTADGDREFLSAEKISGGNVKFIMPAESLKLSFADGNGKKEPGPETAKETEKETEKETAGETEKQPETAEEPETVKEPETGKEPETSQKEEKKERKLTFEVRGDAYVNIYYGISSFDEAMAHKGTRETFTDSYTLDLSETRGGKVWVYAQSTGDYGYSGVSLLEKVERTVLRSMAGMGGFLFLRLDASGFEGEDGTVVLDFSGNSMRIMRAAANAADAFNTSTRKKLTGLTYTWVGGQPSMYEPKPSTGESAVWGNGTWTVPRPALAKVFELFGVTKPSNVRFTDVGTDGKGNVYMRCTGVADQSSHASLGAGDAYIQCIDIDKSDSSVTYTFKLWGANGGRGQTTEGFFQIISESEEDKPTKIRLHKTLRAGSVTDLLGNTRTGDLSNAKFRIYKLNSAGIKKIEAAHNDTDKTADAWWDVHDGRAKKKEILGYIEKLILKENAKPGDAETGNLNPNPDYFSVVSSYATGSGGWTDRFPVDTGVKDYYIAFERKSPDGMNLGYQGSSGIPEGKHYFYKIFSVYDNDSIIAIDGEGGSENNTEDKAVTFGDDPILTEMKLGKKVSIQPEAKGLSWSDFEFFVSDNASFSGKVATVKLTGEETTVNNFLVGEKYYLKENPNSPACKLDVGYVPSTTVYSFSLQEDGKALFSDTHPGELDAPEAVDAYIHLKIEILNTSTTGPLKLVKASSAPDITENNTCYSLAGATYDIYQKDSATAPNSGGTKRGTLVTDETGASNVLEDIPTGYYYAVETAAPKGFKINEEPVPFVVRSGVETNKVIVEDEPLDDPIKVLLQKKDSETRKITPQAGAVLEGAEYTINYYDGYYQTSDELKAITPFRHWIFRTDSDGKVDLSTSIPISGGDLYYDEWGKAVFPLGTISIQETKAPDGYKLDPTIYVYKLAQGSDVNLEAWNTPEFLEEPERGDFKFPKITEDGTPLADIPFKITSNTTGESHIIVTDADGILDTSKPHSENTNRGETSEDGIWFGEPEALDDEKGALLYDTYTVEELLCENNKDKFLIEPFTVTVDSDLADTGIRELDPVVNEPKEEPKLKTTATDSESLIHDAYVNETTTITDVVEYANLEVGKEYTFSGYLVQKETGEPLLDADGNKVTAKTTITVPATADDFEPSIEGSDDERYGSGTVELSFTFDSSLLKDKEVVVFEDLYQDQFHVAAHADIHDEGQTVKFRDPKVSTTATEKNTGKHYAPLEREVTIVDEVAYKGLIPGHAYKLSGILMDKATGEPLEVNGEQVKAEKEFTPEEADGMQTLEYTLDSTALEDVSTVVFETIYYKDREVASHADLTDEAQEVYFTGTKIGTTATDNETGLHDGIVNKETTITDRVQYTGLIQGKEYTVSGYLVLRSTGKPLLDAAGKKVEGSVTFTPSEKDGSVDITFTFDSSLLAGEKTVAFETIRQGEREVGVHADISDDDQTVTFHKPGIGTTATEKELGGHEAFVNTKTTITDTVHYKDLVPGVTYTVSGVLMDKDSGKPLKAGGKEVTSEATFVPEAAEGDVEVTFTLDSTKLKGKTTVVFETLYIGGRKIASHAEIGDKKQAVSFKDVEIGTKARDKESGTGEVQAAKKVTVIDKVSYSGLIPGKKYTVSGVLMDKASGKPLKVGGEKVTAKKTFKAEKAKGSAELSFTFDASALAGKTLVAFESLSYHDREIASHTDLKDKDQTVTVKQEEKKSGGASDTSKSPKTADTVQVLPYVILLLITASVFIDQSVRNRKKRVLKKRR